MARNQPGKIARAPAAVRRLAAEMRANGRSIEEIRGALREAGLEVGRSSVGRYTQKLDAAQPLSVAAQLAAMRRAIDDLAAGVRQIQAALERR